MASPEYQRNWYSQHRDEHAARGKQRYQDHKEEVLTAGKKQYRENREYSLARSKAYGLANPERRLLIRAKCNAKRKGVPFNLCVDDIQIPEFCPVLGLKLVVSVSGKSDASPSLDRIIPALGYVRGNVIVVSWRANELKSDATAEELRKIADFYQHIRCS
jgi:hypothetical protein